METPDQTPTRRRRELISTRVLVAGAVLVLLAGAVAVALTLLRRPVTVVVPNVAGLDVPVARSRLGQVRLALERGDVRFSASIAEGAVIEQSPAPGSVVAEGATIRVVVSAGSEEFEMPDVVGMKLDTARETLSAKGLVVRVETAPSQQPSNTVLATLPSPGSTVRTSQLVRVTVASRGAASSALLPFRFEGMSFVIDPAAMPASRAATSLPDVPMEVTRRLRSLLEASGAQVVVTRSISDTDTKDPARAARAADVSATAVIGLSVDPTAKGAAVLLPPSTPERVTVFVASTQLGRALVDSLGATRIQATQGTAVNDPLLTVILAPSARVRLGSVTSESDVAAFRDPGWADGVARAMYRALGDTFAQ